LIAGCGQKQEAVKSPSQSPLKPQQGPAAPPPVEQQAPPRGYLMQRDLPVPRPQQREQTGQPPGPRYDPQRLKDAAEVKSWSNVNIEGKGVDCWLKSCWKNGQMSLRLAMVGNPDGIRMVMDAAKQFRIRFSDATGEQVNEYTVLPEDLTWAPSSVNGGVPTMQFESSVDVSLEEYEQYRQWQFFWDNR
jgi:hypothetical protein